MLRDVATLIEFVGSGGIVTKGRNANLPIDCLPELNRRTSYPIQPGLKRALLRDYPNVAGTFILLRVMDLLQARGNRLVVWPAALEFWRRLNPTEQYFALLEALLFQAQTSVLGGEIRRQDAQEFRTTVVFLGQLSDRWRNFNHYESARDLGLSGQIPPWYLFLLQQFGLVEIRPVPLAEQKRRDWGGRGWLVGGARLTTWGTAMTWALLEFWKANEREDEEADNFEDPPEADLEESPDDLMERSSSEFFSPSSSPASRSGGLFSCARSARSGPEPTSSRPPSPDGVEGVAASGGGSPCRQTLRWMNSQAQSSKRSSWIATTFTTFATATSAAIAGSIITPTPTKGRSRRKSPWPRRIWRAKLKWNSRSTTETLGSSRCVWRKLLPARARRGRS